MRFPPLVLDLYRIQCRLFNSTCAIYCKKKEKKLDVKQLYRLCGASAIKDEEAKEIKSVVGIQLGLSYLSWAQINPQEHTLEDLKVQILPHDTNEMGLNQIYSAVHETIQHLPNADCYVIEQLPKLISGTGGKLHMTLHVTRIQFAAMLVGLLNYRTTSEKQKVVFIKQHVPAKLFKLLVGSEQISSHSVVSKLLSEETYPPLTSIKVDSNILLHYNQSKKVEKEMLGQALLIALAFTEMLIYKNVESYKLLSDFKK